MFKTRLSNDRYSKLLECQSEENASKSDLMIFASKSTRHIVESNIAESLKEFKKITAKDIKNSLINTWRLLEEVAKSLETITISTGMSTYVVDEGTKKLHRLIKGCISKHCYDVKPGAILAAYSAYTKKLQVSESSVKNSNYPLGIGKAHKLHVLSLPVVTPNDKVLAVIDLYRDLKGEKFTEEEQLIGLTITNWLAAAYDKHSSSQILHHENDLHQTMFAVLTDFFKVNKDIDKLIESIAMFIKSVMKISSIKFYRNVVDRQNWAYVYEEVKPNVMIRSEKPKRLIKSTELFATVLKTHKNLNLNINNLKEKSQCYFNLLRNKGIKSTLLVPIVRSGTLIGTMQLTNKVNGTFFTKQDEEFLDSFSKYYSLALHYTNVSLKKKQVERQLQDEKKLLLFMLKPCDHDFNELWDHWKNHTKTKDLPKNFLSFSYYPWRAGEFKLMEESLILLKYSVNDVFEDEESLVSFVIMSKKVYRKNYYHNFEHAFNVTHCMVNIKKLTENILNELEWKALIVAAFCHDMDHPGFTNNFLKATSHYMVELYKESVLENHHSYVAHLLIKELHLFEKFSPEDYKFIMNEIHNAIIDTDLAVYFKRSSSLTSIITNNSFSWDKPEHMNLLKGVIMTTCDLSGQLKPREVAVDLTLKLYKEFYLQGDEEKALGLKPLSMMDRDLTSRIAADQLDFIMLICVPCADILVSFLPQLNPILADVMDLINYWLEIRKQQGISKKEEAGENARLKRINERINKRFKTELDITF